PCCTGWLRTWRSRTISSAMMTRSKHRRTEWELSMAITVPRGQTAGGASGLAAPYPAPVSPRMRRPPSADVAERAGVSRATVSMVLNDRVKGTVAEPTRRRVLEAAEELGYTRSAVALSLKQRRTHTIGLITDEIAT